jgi:hypothetical protein
MTKLINSRKIQKSQPTNGISIDAKSHNLLQSFFQLPICFLFFISHISCHFVFVEITPVHVPEFRGTPPAFPPEKPPANWMACSTVIFVKVFWPRYRRIHARIHPQPFYLFKFQTFSTYCILKNFELFKI